MTKYLLSTILVLFASVAAFGQISPGSQGTLDSARRISVKEAKQAYKKNAAVFVDVRPKDQYDLEHIKGAVNLPLGEAGSARFKSLPKKKLIIVYCSCLNEHTSARMVLDMSSAGVTNASALLGGLDAWKKVGMPTER